MLKFCDKMTPLSRTACATCVKKTDLFSVVFQLSKHEPMDYTNYANKAAIEGSL